MGGSTVFTIRLLCRFNSILENEKIMFLIYVYITYMCVTGKTLQDERTLSEYSVTDGTVVHLLKEKKAGEIIRIYVKALNG